jgi:prefoldin subunit 5
MDEQARARLDQLREEYETGRRQLAELNQRRAQLSETLLRISGAIMVLEELVGGPVGAEANADGPAGQVPIEAVRLAE